MRALLCAAILSFLMVMGAPGFGTERILRPDVVAVRSVYEAFAWEAVIDAPAPGTSLVEQSPSVLMRYFTPELTALILRDRECVARTREICNLDFLPLWDSQDASGATVTLADGPDLGEVLVKVRYPPPEAEKKLVFRLANGSTGWKIADIVYEGVEGNVNGTISLSRLLGRRSN